jgi:ParB/RepB/Spo0J family partition protein
MTPTAVQETKPTPPLETKPTPPLQAVPLVGAMEIPLAQIVPSSTNRRTVRSADKENEIAESILMHGVQQPIVVRPRPSPDTGNMELYKKTIGRAPGADAMYEIVAGETRWLLSHKVGKATIPAVVKKLNNVEALEIQAIENYQREDMDPMDRAEVVFDLYNAYLKGFTPKDAIAKVAARISAEARTVYNMMSLRNLLPDVKKAIRGGEIAMSHGYELATLSAKPQQQVWGWLKQELEYSDSVSVRELREYIKDEVFRRLSGATWNLDDAKLVPAAGACTACPKNTAVNSNLAPDEKKPTCTDPPCFENKEKAQLVQIQTVMQTEHKEGAVFVAIESGKQPFKDVIAREKWRESKEGSCPHTQRVIIATGPNAGKEVQACLTKECKKHFGAGKPAPAAPSQGHETEHGGRGGRTLSAEEKRRRLQQTRGKKLELAYRTVLSQEMRKSVKQLGPEDLKEVAHFLYDSLHLQLQNAVAEAMGWKSSRSEEQEIARMKPAECAAFLSLMVTGWASLPGLPDYYDFRAKEAADVAGFAKRHKINLAKIKATAEAPLKAKFVAIDARKKKQAKPAQTSAKAKGKKKAKKAA